MRCASCGFENPQGTKFCGECGSPLTTRCQNCSAENPPQFKFCGECGIPLRAAGQSAPRKHHRKETQTLKRATRPVARPTTARPDAATPDAERRQLTVMFCDLVGSTALSMQLDPEELREVVRDYQHACATVISRYEGHIAQYLGDGLLVYFGYPVAHEDDAQRAVRTGLEIVAVIHQAPRLQARGVQVRIGIHTGQVVVGEVGAGGKREQLALGNTPNIAARLQGLAAPNTVIVSAATQRLIQGLFDCQDLNLHSVQGVSAPLQVYRVLSESSAQSRLEVEVSTGRLTPLVGRANEVGLILERWAAAQAGDGQVVLLSGEPGIGKSRLMQEVKAQVLQQGATSLEFRCLPYYQNSAFYPVITYLHRVLHFQQDDTPQAKLAKLQQTLAHYRFPQADTLPLLAALLSLPQPPGAPLLNFSPQKQKQRTQEAVVAWFIEEAEQAPMYCAWEDVHWADPSTLELLGLFLDQVSTSRLLVLLTARPEFTPPWTSRIPLTPLTLTRLPRIQAAELIEKVTGGKRLPTEVQQQIVSKTEGVPLFVEELTKMVLELGLLREADGQYELTGPLPPLAIPSTLQDSLMARLDRLATVKEVAQMGATLGREFSYELLQAVAPIDEEALQAALTRLVEAEVLYQRGAPPQARYVFKHALIQDAAYQSLLKSTRQQYHRQIAQILEERFPETKETQPELLAHHYSEAGLVTQAISYWQHAGERAVQRSAYVEAVAHLTRGLEVLKALPDTPERVQQELTLQLALNNALVPAKGYTAPEVGKAVTRARELCQQLGETPQLFPVLWSLFLFYLNRGEFQAALELAELLLRLAQSVQDNRYLLSVAHEALGSTLYWRGEFASARTHLEQASALYDPQTPPHLTVGTADPRVNCLSYAAWTLWHLGYPDQALKRSQEEVALAAGLSHPYSLAYALGHAAWLQLFRRKEQAARERAEAAITLSTEQGFPSRLAIGTVVRGGTLIEQGQVEEGIAQMQQGLAAFRAMGAEGGSASIGLLPWLAAAYARAGQVEEGLSVVAEALAVVDKTGGRFSEAELYRLKGELLLKKSEPRIQKSESNPESAIPNTQHPTPSTQAEAAACFLKAIEIARQQQAKSLELRAVMNLARLWQQQGKRAEARQMLAEIYGWFTEGFDTKDLQEAKALLEDLA